MRILAVALLLATPIQAARGQTAAALADTLRFWARARGELFWSAAHPVEWPDFKGVPNEGGSTAAETTSGVSYTMFCHGEEMRFAALATFSPAKSWVKAAVPRSRSSDRILRHERTHFNISELFARALRRDLTAARDLCPSRTEEGDRIFGRLKHEFDDLQDRYDHETRHGVSLKEQAAWFKMISARLDSTSRWASP